MPKRKKSELPTIKKGANGDFFCYYGGKKVYLARDEEKAKEKLVRMLEAEIAIGEKGKRAARAEQDRSIAVEPVSAGNVVKVQEILLDFLKENQEHRDLSKIRRVVKIAYEMYGDMDAEDFGQVAFLAVRKKLVRENLSWNYINDLMAFVKSAFRRGVENRKISENVYFFLTLVKPLRRGQAKTNPPRMDVSDEDFVKTLPFLLPTVRDMVVLQRISGMRPSEMFKIRACDLDMSGDVWLYCPVGKTARFGIQRTIGFGRFEQEILKRRMEGKSRNARLFSPLDTIRDRYGDSIAKDARETRQLKPEYNKNSYRRAITRAIERANATFEKEGREDRIQPWTPYQLRHASATFLSLYMGQDAAAAVLGHVNTRITQVYDHSQKLKVVEIVRRRDELFGEQIKGLIGED